MEDSIPSWILAYFLLHSGTVELTVDGAACRLCTVVIFNQWHSQQRRSAVHFYFPMKFICPSQQNYVKSGWNTSKTLWRLRLYIFATRIITHVRVSGVQGNSIKGSSQAVHMHGILKGRSQTKRFILSGI